jgi:hypothetical protein
MPFHPYYTAKDSVGICVFLIVFALLRVLRAQPARRSEQLHPGQSAADAADIVPEWYFLPYYAILRSVPNKLLGVCMMFGSLLVLFVLPWLDTSPGAQRAVPADLSPGSSGCGGDAFVLGCAARIGRKASGSSSAGSHLLLLPPFPGDAADPRQARAAAAAAREHQPRRCWAAAAAAARCTRPSRGRSH